MNSNWPIIIRIRDKFGSQVNFAQALGISETLVSKIVRGRRKLDPQNQMIWAKALECDPKDLFPHED